ncbi:MAG TPA: RidA family protein [Candidatus Dormibacteraeota bacterium]|nr:RidA family protein [Candidatus Dormibacteraeota bacterium]
MTPPFSPVRRIGDVVALSGQTGVRDGELVGGGFLAELQQALENLGRLLDGAGLSPRDVIKVNVYLTDIADWKRLNQPYADFFGEPYPARTALAVAALPGGAKVEIEAWAISP